MPTHCGTETAVGEGGIDFNQLKRGQCINNNTPAFSFFINLLEDLKPANGS